MSTPLALFLRQGRLLLVRDTLDTNGPAAVWFYTGSDCPPTPETPTSETLLCQISLAVPCGAMGTAVDEVTGDDVATLTMSVPRTGSVIATGVIGWARWVSGEGLGIVDRKVVSVGFEGPVIVSDTQVYAGGELQLLSCVLAE